MATIDQVKRRLNIQVAEGYLDLAEILEDRWPLSIGCRQLLADRAIATLSQIRNPLGYRPHILYLKGQAHRVAFRFDQAVRYFRLSAKIDPENLHCLLALAWCYKRTDELNLAIETLLQGLQIEPESAITHYNLACYAALAKDVDLALSHLVSALALDPDFAKLVPHEADFDSIRDDARFHEIVETAVTG